MIEKLSNEIMMFTLACRIISFSNYPILKLVFTDFQFYQGKDNPLVHIHTRRFSLHLDTENFP